MADKIMPEIYCQFPKYCLTRYESIVNTVKRIVIHDFVGARKILEPQCCQGLNAEPCVAIVNVICGVSGNDDDTYVYSQGFIINHI